MDEFDNKITNRIREVFENYEHPSADEGWTKLRERFPAQTNRNKTAWLWWSSAAAILLVFLGIGLWVKNQDTPVKEFANTKPAKHQQKDSLSVENDIAQTKPSVKNDSVQTSAPAYARQIATTSQRSENTGKSDDFVPPKSPAISTGLAIAKNQPIATSDNQNALTINPDQQVGKTELLKVDNANSIARTESVKSNNINSIAKTQPADVEKPNTIVKQPAKVTPMFADEDLQNTVKKDGRQNTETKKVDFGLYAATYFNYAPGSSNQINAGAGFTSDIKLSKNLKLSTGVSLAQNTLSYNNTPPASGAALVATGPALKRDALFASATATAVPEFRKYNASLIGLDIPINIKYEFNPQKSDTYISAGLSSGTFIDEKYTYLYSYYNSQSKETSQVQDETAHKSFNSFYFGKTLNVAFGVGMPVGKNNRLIFEPFLKYPLGSLGSQQINFGAGGINLKFNFKGNK